MTDSIIADSFEKSSAGRFFMIRQMSKPLSRIIFISKKLVRVDVFDDLFFDLCPEPFLSHIIGKIKHIYSQ